LNYVDHGTGYLQDQSVRKKKKRGVCLQLNMKSQKALSSEEESKLQSACLAIKATVLAARDVNVGKLTMSQTGKKGGLQGDKGAVCYDHPQKREGH